MEKSRIVILCSLLAACAPDDEELDVAEASAELTTLTPITPIFVRPAITGINPTTGVPGTVVTITGRGFDTLFSGPAAFGSTTLTAARSPITYVSSTTMTTVVPAGARTGPIHIMSNLTVVGGSPWVQLSSSQTFTPIVVPAAPSGLTATAVSDSQINLAWVDNSWNESAFEVSQRCGAGNWVVLGSVNANQTSEPITGLLPSSTCSYRLRATNATGPSVYSNTATATTFARTATVSVTSATGNSPLQPNGVMNALQKVAYVDSDNNGLVAGTAGSGPFPVFPNGQWIVQAGSQFATVSGTRANFILVAEIPQTAGSNGGAQYVTWHFRLTWDAQGNITGGQFVFGTGGDFTTGFWGRIMTAYASSYNFSGNINTRVYGFVEMSLFLQEFYPTPSGLDSEIHDSSVHMDFDLPVTAK
jgi:hypothetical protein